MRAELIRELEGRDPGDLEVIKTVRFPERPKQNDRGQWIWPIGTVTSHPFCFRLVQMGVAIPVDDACKTACRRSEEQQSQAQIAYKRVAAGIHPQDYDLYNSGQILGYNPDGTYIPGPNAAAFDDEVEDDSEEENDEELSEEDE